MWKFLLCLAVFGFSVSQGEITVVFTSGATELSPWFAYQNDAVIKCEWSYNYETGDEVITKVEVTWQVNNTGIRKIKEGHENNTDESFVYTSSPIPEDRQSIECYLNGVDGGWCRLTVYNFAITDGGEYKCLVEVNKAQSGVDIDVKAFATPTVSMFDVNPIADLREKERIVAENSTEPVEEEEEQSIEVQCAFDGAYPRPSGVNFYLAEELIAEGIEANTTQDTALLLFGGVASYKLAADKKYDGKHIKCAVVTEAGTTKSQNESSAFTILYDTSTVTTHIYPEAVAKGESATITCEADGNPPPVFAVNPDSAVTKESDGTFIVVPATMEDNGQQFQCIAYTGEYGNKTVKSEEKATMTVQWLELSPGEANVDAKKGDTIKLECEATGNPMPTIYWEKDGKRLSGQYGSYEISKAKYEDSGDYVCVAQNDAGEKSRTVKVDVNGACEANFGKAIVSRSPVTPAKKEEEVGYFVKLTCEVSGYPPCSVSITPQATLNKGGNLKKEKDDGSSATYTYTYDSLGKLGEPVEFFCVAKNSQSEKPANDSIKLDKSTGDICCAEPAAASGLSAGAVIGIILLVLVVLIGIPVACYFVKKRKAQPKKKAPADTEAPESEKEGLNKEASSERPNEEP